MNRRRRHPGLAIRTTALAAGVAVLGVVTFEQPARAQAASATAGTPASSDSEAMARAQRAADRVKEFILMNSKLNALPVAPAKAPAHPAPRPAPTRQAAPPPATRVVASGAGGVVPAATPSTSAPGSVQSLSAAEAASTRPLPDAALLFDFETSTEGFTLHSLAEWAELPAAGITLTPQAVQGQSALQATSATDAWLGVDLSDAVDFSALKRITFWMRSARGVGGRLAIKSGSQYDWCELRASAIGTVDGFVNYEVALQAKARECKNLDLEDVRGLHWFVRAGDTVILDNVKLR